MPIDPCGRIMDVLRSCYSVDIRPFRDDLSRTVRIRYYFVPATAAPYSGFSPFTSLNYTDAPHANTGLGEVPGTRAYDKGVAGRIGEATSGSCDTAALATGALTTDPVPERDSDGIPACCGVVVPCCPGVVLPLTLYYQFGLGGTGHGAALDGTNGELHYGSPGSYQWLTPPFVIGSATYQIYVTCEFGGFGLQVYYTGPPFPAIASVEQSPPFGACTPLDLSFPPASFAGSPTDYTPPLAVTQ